MCAAAGAAQAKTQGSPQEVTVNGDRKRLNHRWTAKLPDKRSDRWWLLSHGSRRHYDGFLILPDAFSDGPLSREAWREVKAGVARLRSTQHPETLRLRALRARSATWESVPYEVQMPIHATRVEFWRSIHLVRHIAAARCGQAENGDNGIGIAVEAEHKASSHRRDKTVRESR